MVTPRDWLPPYPPGDERNAQHRRDYDRYGAVYPDTPAWERQQYADMKLAARENNPQDCGGIDCPCLNYNIGGK